MAGQRGTGRQPRNGTFVIQPTDVARTKKKICYCCPNYLVNGLSGVNVLDLCFSHGWFCENNQPAAELMQQIMSQLHRHHQIRVTKNKALVLFFVFLYLIHKMII